MDENSRINYMGAAFTKIDKKVDDLFEMKDKKKKFLFVTWHQYTAEKLFESATYNSIQSYILKIKDDIDNWENAGELVPAIRTVYNANRDLLEERILDLKEAVEKREPTIWEKIGNFFKGFIKFIADNLPRIWNGIMFIAHLALGKSGFIGTAAKKLIGLGKKITKICAGKNLFISAK